jgi:phosphate acyltransferase
MQERIRNEPIWQKNPKQQLSVRIAKILSFPIASVPLADIITIDPLSRLMKPKNPRIGIDLLGGENPPDLLISSLVEWKKNVNASFLLLATEELCKAFKSYETPSFEFYPVQEAIGLEENPLSAIRKKKNSSLVQGIRLLKEKKIDTFLSSGNTGALVSLATIELLMPHVKRPALMALLPTKKNPLALIDVGANVAVKAKELKTFALMGAAFQKFNGINIPNVGLLNVGSEAIKGTKEIQEAYVEIEKLSKKKGFFFSGNIEANEIFEGNVDVLVTDGFAGNVLLKTAEGFSSFVLDFFQKHPAFQEAHKFFSYSEYGGALLLGVEGTCIKCHSYSSTKAFLSALQMAIHWSQKDFPNFLKKYLS